MKKKKRSMEVSKEKNWEDRNRKNWEGKRRSVKILKENCMKKERSGKSKELKSKEGGIVAEEGRLRARRV